MNTTNPHVLRILAREYRTLNLKTVFEGLPDMARRISDEHPDALVAFVQHRPADGVPHFHLVVRFVKPTNLKKCLTVVSESDPCFYCAPCRLFKASYRYLAHLDNPEKHRVFVDDIVRIGDWDGIPLADWHQQRRINVDLSELVVLCKEFLIERGVIEFEPERGPLVRENITLIQFGCWLEGKSINPRSALGTLRAMGIEFSSLVSEALSYIKEVPSCN